MSTTSPPSPPAAVLRPAPVSAPGLAPGPATPPAPTFVPRRSPALRIHAGPRARAALQRDGLRPRDVVLVPGAAGGPKGLVLHPIDQFLFADWLPQGGHTVHLVGASIGAWRMSAACQARPREALRRMLDDYLRQDYAHAPGRAPSPAHVSEVFGRTLAAHLDGARAAEILQHPHYRLHVVASRGRHLLHRERRFWTALGYAGAFLANSVHRRALGAWLERLVLSDPRTPLPLPLDELPTRTVALTAANLQPGVLASCSIPFWLSAVHDIPGAPPGACWDGGITDYHLHWAYDRLPATPASAGLVLYPHFQPRLVPGWLDKAFAARHRATARLDNVLLLSPHPDWVRSLPGGKLPDRADFKTYADDLPGRITAWGAAVGAAQQLADELAGWLAAGTPLDRVEALV